MAEIYKFFNSAPGDERWYYASDFAEYFGDVLSSGLLYEEDSMNLQVRVVQGTLKTIVEPGKALIKGYRYWNTTPLELSHSIPEIDADRIDRIVLRMDIRNNARSIRAFVKEGVSAAEPVPPELQRDNYVYELSLAQVRVTKNTASLVPENLVDERMYEELCGTVSSIISVPTTVFQQQWDVWFNSKKVTLGDDMEDWMVDQQQAFTDWFATIQGLLDGDVAANLANYIASVEGQLTSHMEEDNNIKHKANQISVVNPDTDEEEDLQTFAEQLFQSGVNAKSDVVTAINAKGGSVTTEDEWSDLASAIDDIPTGKREVSGTITSSNATQNFVDSQGYTATSPFIEVVGLPFKPSVIEFFYEDSTNKYEAFYTESNPNRRKVIHLTRLNKNTNQTTYPTAVRMDVSPAYITATGFKAPVAPGALNLPVQWFARE